MSIKEICSRAVVIVSPNETVREAAGRMARLTVGTLVVIDPAVEDRPIGLITDRDLVTRCLAAGLDPDETTIGACMSTPARTIAAGASVEEALAAMAEEGVRRLVVVEDDERLLGMLSLDDVLAHRALEDDEVRRLVMRRVQGHGSTTSPHPRERHSRPAPARRTTGSRRAGGG